MKMRDQIIKQAHDYLVKKLTNLDKSINISELRWGKI